MRLDKAKWKLKKKSQKQIEIKFKEIKGVNNQFDAKSCKHIN